MNYNEIAKKLGDPSPITNVQNRFYITNKKQPVSLTELEFNFITNFVVENQLKTGFEVATGFGVSALAAGLGFHKVDPVNGYLVSMDAYIEEHMQTSKYQDQPLDYKARHTLSGIEIAEQLFDAYDISNTVEFQVGISPFDTHHAITDAFGDNKLDYAFIDAEHTDLAIATDIISVAPFMKPHSYILLHDGHFVDDMTRRVCKRLFGKKPRFAFGDKVDKSYNAHYNLMIMEIDR